MDVWRWHGLVSGQFRIGLLSVSVYACGPHVSRGNRLRHSGTPPSHPLPSLQRNLLRSLPAGRPLDLSGSRDVPGPASPLFFVHKKQTRRSGAAAMTVHYARAVISSLLCKRGELEAVL
ncbi:hypothetical protein DL93DRAFT_1388923 [Clavulina sp. PMI_390]|nr:hypothetical protein DL93DRAFT_1388923 [Clavulina sp. PMI_390]